MLIIANSTFTYAGGHGVVIFVVFCYAAYFFYSDHWQDSTSDVPINEALQSISFRYSLIFSIGASIPPLIELVAETIITKGNLSLRTMLLYSELVTLILEALVTLIFISPIPDSKLYICTCNAALIVSLFIASAFLCLCSPKFWKTKWSTASVTLVYIGSMMATFPPYFHNYELLAQRISSVFLVIGCAIFIIKTYKFVLSELPDDRNSAHVISDDLLARFCSVFVSMVMIGRLTLYFGTGLPYWTNYGKTFLCAQSIITFAPSIGMCMGFSHATRNEAYFMQVTKSILFLLCLSYFSYFHNIYKWLLIKRVRQKFVRYISHEMRTPLNTAIMGLQYLRSELVKSSRDTELLDVVDEVKGACEISVTILNEMLDYDKLQSGLMKLEIEEIPVKSFLETTISPFYAQANNKNIALQYNPHDSTLNSLLIEIDTNKFAQVIRNLISNALKFTPVGGTVRIITTVSDCPQPPQLPVTATTSLATSSLGGCSHAIKLLRIDVIDSGVGVSKENQQKLFKEIVQFNPGKLQSGGGSGLGLYISKGIMDLHQGDLSIASEGEGFGCTFTITLHAKYIREAVLVVSTPNIGEHKENNGNHALNSIRSKGGRLSYTSSYRLGESMSMNSLHFNPSSRIKPEEVDEVKESVSIRSSTTIQYLTLTSGKVIRSTKYMDIRSPQTESVFTRLLVVPPSDEPSPSLSHPSVPFLSSQPTTTASTVTTYTPTPTPLYKILVVDDSISNRKMLMRLIRDKCTVITEAADGVEAVNIIKTAMVEEDRDRVSTGLDFSNSPRRLSDSFGSNYDAVLMDFIMPNMEGPEAARGMRELGYTGLIVGITGNAMSTDKDKFISHGANLVLTKPVNIIELEKAFQLIVSANHHRI